MMTHDDNSTVRDLGERCAVCGGGEAPHNDAACRAEYEGDDTGRFCPECGEDILGNDPHAPGCPNEGGDEVAWTDAERAEFVNGYCEAADFANADNDWAELATDHQESIEADCTDFLEGSNGCNVLRYMDELNATLGAAGADFYFTRNGHATGFWDRSYHPDHVGFLRELSENARPYGSTEY